MTSSSIFNFFLLCYVTPQYADYQDVLSRRRLEDKLQRETELHNMTLEKQEESLRKQEAMKLGLLIKLFSWGF